MDHNDILGIVIARNTFTENGVEPVGEGTGNLLGGSGIAVCAEFRQFLNNVQFLNIPGNGGLGAGYTGLLQRFQQLLLGFNIPGGDDLHDLCLSLRFHHISPLI